MIFCLNFFCWCFLILHAHINLLDMATLLQPKPQPNGMHNLASFSWIKNENISATFNLGWGKLWFDLGYVFCCNNRGLVSRIPHNNVQYGHLSVPLIWLTGQTQLIFCYIMGPNSMLHSIDHVPARIHCSWYFIYSFMKIALFQNWDNRVYAYFYLTFPPL